MPLTIHPRELTASFRNRNTTFNQRFLATHHPRAKQTLKRRFFDLKQISELYFYSENFLDDSSLEQKGSESGMTCPSAKGRISLCAKTRGGGGESGDGEMGLLITSSTSGGTQTSLGHPHVSLNCHQ